MEKNLNKLKHLRRYFIGRAFGTGRHSIRIREIKKRKKGYYMLFTVEFDATKSPVQLYLRNPIRQVRDICDVYFNESINVERINASG